MKMAEESEGERYCFAPALRWNPDVQDYFVKAYGRSRFELISRCLTTPPLYSSIRINTINTTRDGVIQKLSSILQGKDCFTNNKSAVSEQFYEKDKSYDVDGTCADPQFGDIFRPYRASNITEASDVEDSASLVTDPTEKHKDLFVCKLSGLEDIIAIKGSGPFKIRYDNNGKDNIKEVIVSRKCAESVLRGADVFVPGVLACSAHVEKGDMVAVSVAIERNDHGGGWSVGFTRGITLSGENTDPCFSERKGLYIGRGIITMSRATLFRELQGVAIKMVDRVFNHPPLHGVLTGDIFLQNLPSIITAYVLDPKPGERILDLCAAPGGKTTAIASLMKDKGEVVAIDRSHNKVEEIKSLVQELGFTCIRAYKLDALKSVRKALCDDEGSLGKKCDILEKEGISFPSDQDTHGDKLDSTTGNNEICGGVNGDRKQVSRKMKNGPGRGQGQGGRVQQSKGFERESFDRVLLDAPCSALGLRPRLFAGEETVESLRRHAKYQKKMFDQAVQLVRPGGVIVYSTCTINPGENEAIVRYALDTYKFLSLAPQDPKVGGPGLVGGIEQQENWLKGGEQHMVQRFDPSGGLDTIGFFIAKFEVRKAL